MKLTVVILTYNHEKYIKQTLDSILMQKTDFKFNIIIADDGSTDDTITEIEKFKSTSSIEINNLYHSSNIGVLNNALSVLNKIQSDYIAFLDGDDYWILPNKLQQQVDFLDSNENYSGIFHNTAIISDKTSSAILFGNSSKYSDVYKYQKEIYPADIIKRLIVPTSSLLLRTDFLQNIDLLLFKDNYSIIWKLCCLAIKNSKFYYLDEVMSVYRNHEKGISKSKNIQFHFSHTYFLESLSKRKDFEEYLLDIYTALSKEYILVIERTIIKDNKLKKVFFRYILSELKKTFYFYKSIFK